MTSAPEDRPPDPTPGPDDAAAMAELMHVYLPRLRAYVRTHLPPELRARESSCDLVQSVCRELIEHQDRFRYQGEAEFRGWLFTAAANKVNEKIRFHRQARRDVGREAQAGSVAVDLAARGSDSPSRLAIANERLETLESALDELGDGDREVIALVRLAGLSIGEVAARLGKSEAAARKQLGRALVRLSAALRRPDRSRSGPA